MKPQSNLALFTPDSIKPKLNDITSATVRSRGTFSVTFDRTCTLRHPPTTASLTFRGRVEKGKATEGKGGGGGRSGKRGSDTRLDFEMQILGRVSDEFNSLSKLTRVSIVEVLTVLEKGWES